MGLMRANALSNLVRPEEFLKIDFSMKWQVFQLCVNLVKCSQDPRGRIDFFQIFLSYSLDLLGLKPNTVRSNLGESK
jgi:hypothetical protein